MIRKNYFLIIVFLFFLLICTCTSLVYASNLKIGIEQYRMENFEEAIFFLEQAYKNEKNKSISAFYLGLAYKQIGDLKKARTFLEKSIVLHPPVVDGYVELIQLLYSMGEIDEAEKWLKKAERKNIASGKLYFLKGLVNFKKGNYKGAISYFSKAKNLDNSLAQNADLQIALVYGAQKRFSEAKDILKSLISINPNSDIAKLAQEYDKQITKWKYIYKKWHIYLDIQYQYNSNVVSKPTEDIIVNISKSKDSNIYASIRLDYLLLEKNKWSILSQTGFFRDNYFEIKSYRDMGGFLSIIPAKTLNVGFISFPITLSHYWLDNENYMDFITFKPTFLYKINNSNYLQLKAGIGKREMIDPPYIDEEDRDGEEYSSEISYIYSFSQGKGMANIYYSFVRDFTDGKNWERKDNNFGATILIPYKKISFLFGFQKVFKDFVNKNTIFKKDRDDEIFNFNGGINIDINNNTKIISGYTYTRNLSNIPVYDYKRHIISFGIQYTF